MSPDARRLSFRLPRPLGCIVGGAVILLLVFAFRIALPFYRQEVAIAEIQRAGGFTSILSGGPDWLRKRLGPRPMQYFDEVRAVSLADTTFTDAHLAHIACLTDLQSLSLSNTNVTDAGLTHLRRMTHLRELWLDGTQVTDAGLSHLKRLPRLESLSLQNTAVTDAGLLALHSRISLRALWLADTPTSRRGIATLRQSLPDLTVIK